MLRSSSVALVTASCLLCLLASMPGCDSTSRPKAETNLVENGSFETNRMPSLKGWTLLNPNLAASVQDGAPGGGYWSLKLTADWAPTSAVVWQKVEGVKSGDVLTLTSYVKAYEGGGGVIKLECGPQPLEPSRERWVSSDVTDWVRLTLTDTLSLSAGDSVWVVLSSENTEVVARIGLFDNVRLVRDGE